MTVLISVIIPTYNCLPTLPRAIESVRIQEMNVELIVIDDGSTDGSSKWLQQQSDVQLIKTPHIGVSKARNLGIKKAKGTWIAFLDADDCWLTGKLKRQSEQHRLHSDLIFSFTDYDHVTEDGTHLITCFQYWPKFFNFLNHQPTIVWNHLQSHLYAENVVGTSTVLANREALLCVGGFDSSLPSASDWDLWLKLSGMGKTLTMNQVLCLYTQGRGNSMTQNYCQRLLAMNTILHRYRRQVLSSPLLCMAGYSRWVVAYAEFYRMKDGYFRSALLELVACGLQPALVRLRFFASDLLKLGQNASASLFSLLKFR